MRILLMGLNYLPESTSIGPYTADLAEYLQEQGHQVKVITGFPLAPQWRVWDGYRGKFFQREIINGVLVQRTYLYVPENPKKTIKRILFDTSFMLSALVGGIFSGKSDLIVVVSPPLQSGLTGWLLSLLKRAPFFFHIQDLVPDAAIATGMLNEKSRAVRLARALERFIYGRAAGVGVICDGFVRNLNAKGIDQGKIFSLPNYIDLNFMHLEQKDNQFRQDHSINPTDFVVMYSGSVALKQGLETFVNAAAELRDYANIKFFLVGEGPYLNDIKLLAFRLNLDNLHLLPLQPRGNLPQQLAAADVLVVTQKRAVTDIVFPGKLLYYMAAGRPILAAVSADSETGRFISENQVGVVTPPEDPKALAAAILKLHCQGVGELGQNGRKVAEERFDRRVVLKQFTSIFEELVGPKKGPVGNREPALDN